MSHTNQYYKRWTGKVNVFRQSCFRWLIKMERRLPREERLEQLSLSQRIGGPVKTETAGGGSATFRCNCKGTQRHAPSVTSKPFYGREWDGALFSAS